MRCKDRTELREQIDDLLAENFGLQRLTTIEQAEVLITAAIELLAGRGGREAREHAADLCRDLVERWRDAAAMTAKPR